MKALPFIIVPVLALSLMSCDGLGVQGSDDDQIGLHSSGIAMPGFTFGTMLLPFDGGVYFLASEAAQGNTDLNGDGDAADNVVFYTETVTPSPVNLGVSARRPLLRTTSHVVWVLAEGDEGGTDWSGDGDIADQVLVRYDPSLPLGPTNPTITSITVTAGTPMGTWGDLVVFITAESEIGAGVDLNGDGDMSDSVLRIFDATTASVVFNPMLAWDTALAGFNVANGLAVFLVSEGAQGGTDLNGDGDTSDSVVQGIDLAALTSFPVGGLPGQARATASGVLPIAGTTAAPVILYTISESAEGNVSFNGNTFVGDTDTADDILAVYDVNTGTETLPMAGLAIDAAQFAVGPTRAVFVADEAANTGSSTTDFNSDGDGTDEVPFWIDLQMPASPVNLGQAATAGDAMLALCDEFVIYSASEADNGALGTNYNADSGDSDTADDVAFFTDVSSPGIPSQNTGFATDQIVCFPGRFFLLASESEQNGTDLNGDGDNADVVPIYFIVDGPTAIRQGEDVVNTDGPLTFVMCDNIFRIWANVSEADGFGDLNNDGDEDDYILQDNLVGTPTGEMLFQTAVDTCDRDGTSFPFVIDADTIAYPFAEEKRGVGFDANGDGDSADVILKFINMSCF